MVKPINIGTLYDFKENVSKRFVDYKILKKHGVVAPKKESFLEGVWKILGFE